PTLTAVVLGGTYIVSSWENAVTYQRVVQLANLSSAVTHLAGALEDERDATVQYVAEAQAAKSKSRPAYGKANPSDLGNVTTAQTFSGPWIKEVRRQLGGIGAGYPAQVQGEAQTILGQLNDVTAVRQAALQTQLPALDVITKYTNIIDALLTIDD